MKKGVSTLFALVLIIMIAIVATAGAYYWVSKVQVGMQAGTEEYEKEFTKYATKQLDIISFDYDPATYSSHIIMRNIGLEDLERLGSWDDRVVIISKEKTCDMPFNSTTCDECPFDLKVNRIQAFNLDFWGTDCENVEKGTQYELYFSLGDADVRAYTTFIGDIAPPKWNQWTNMSPASGPSARHSHAMATVYGEGKVLLFGGYDGSYDSETWVYDLNGNTWTQKILEIKPSARSNHAMAMVYDNNKVVLFGGVGSVGCDGSESGYCNGTWVYDLNDDTWTQKTPTNKPGARNSHAMATVYNDDKVVLFGGGDGGLDNETWVYDLSEDNWTLKNPSNSPSARAQHAMATVYGEDKIVLFGGLDTGENLLNDTWVYDYGDNTWTEISPESYPSARREHAMAMIDGTDKVLLFGGRDAEGYDDETWVYDSSAYSWTLQTLSTSPSVRDRHAMAAVYGTYEVVLFGGTDDASRNDETWVFS